MHPSSKISLALPLRAERLQSLLKADLLNAPQVHPEFVMLIHHLLMLTPC